IDGAGTGQVALRLGPEPVGLTPGYYLDAERNVEAFGSELYLTGDLMSRDAKGIYTYVGRADDLFKDSAYKLSPVQLENGLLGYPAIPEVAVVPSRYPLRTAVPKSYVVLAPRYLPTAETPHDLLSHARTTLQPYARIRRLALVSQL